jgi:hypothetical protein
MSPPDPGTDPRRKLRRASEPNTLLPLLLECLAGPLADQPPLKPGKGRTCVVGGPLVRRDPAISVLRLSPGHDTSVLCPFPENVGAGVPVNLKKSPQMSKARSRTRTDDPFLTMEVLYRLSYPGGLHSL